MNRENIIKYIKEYLSNESMFGESVSVLEDILSAIIGFNKSLDGYEGQKDDYEKLISKLESCSILNIENICEVINNNKPWNYKKVLDVTRYN